MLQGQKFFCFDRSKKMKRPKGAIIESADAIVKAAKIFGTEKALAEKIGVSRERLFYWKINTLLPYDKAVSIYIVTDGQVDINELRPDLRRLTKKFVAIFIKKELENKQ
jgi:DNA-binding transcriptional regulator YdaS (Cro superfamily)